MIRLTGAKEIDDVLRGLPLQVTDKVLQNSFADAAKPLVDAARSLAPEGETGNLKESIGVTKEPAKTLVNRAVGQIQVGPRRKGKYKGFAGHLLEFGTTVRETKSGANRGNVTPDPFMEPAFNQTSLQVENRINNSIGRKLSAFMRRTIKNAR
jgi:HK97 gp10 family phage protein